MAMMKKIGGVEEYLAAIPDEAHATLEKVRRAIRAATPDAAERLVRDARLLPGEAAARVIRDLQGALQLLPHQRGGDAGVRERTPALRVRQGDDPVPDREAAACQAVEEDGKARI